MKSSCLTVLIASLATLAGAALPIAAVAQQSPIRIGLSAPLTGTGGAYGKEEEDAAKAAAAYINDAGGVLGRKIEIVVADDETSPTAGVAAARKLIDVDKVIAITGLWSSAVALAVKPVAIEKGVAVLANGSADEITQGDNKGLVWRFQTNGQDWGRAFARVVKGDGAKTASVLVLQTPFTLSQVQPFAETFKSLGGEIKDIVYFNPNQPSYRTEVEKVFSAKPDAVFVASYIPEFSAIAREVFRSGYDSKLYTYSHAADSQGKFVQNVGKEAAEGVNHVQLVPVGRSDAYKLYLKLTKQPSDALLAFGPNVFDQIVVLALAIEKAKSDKPAEFVKEFIPIANSDAPSIGDPAEALKAIRTGKPFRFAGATSDFKFKPNGDQTGLEYGHFRIHDGVSKLVGSTR